MRHSTAFLSIRTEGALFPADILAQIASKTFEGVTPEAYHLDGENLNEAISRSWNRLLGVWKSFQTARAALPPGDFGTTLTREKWLYKLFQELGYGRLQTTRPFEIDGKSYPVSHLWRNVPIHLVGCGVDIDKTHVSPGIVRHQPHGMVQEFLNRSDDHLFALLSNGLRLRLLRDNASLVRRAFVEFDLESMMDGESFPDFSLLWLLCHQSRVEADRLEEFPLERWVQEARKEGVQALDRLREGVEGAIVALGAGFLEHRANEELRDALRAGRLDRQDYYRSVLRLVYRLVFLFVAEERDLLCPVEPGGEGATRRRQYLTRYLPHYSLTRIRRLAERHPGSRHDDLYRMTSFVLERLGDAGSTELGLSPLGSGLFDPETSDPLSNSRLSNHAFLDATRALTILSDEGHGRRPISYRNLGSEELGSVYEFLLELHPDLNLDAMTFALKSAAGNERRTTGSYYTPTSLIESLLKTALETKLDEAARQPDPEKAILGLKVCDPACGSGHFLVAAAHRMAGRLGQIRCGGEPSALVFRQALRDVIGHCLYGVDINPMSVELCKVSLWMEALDPGKPLSFLDHHIRAGNSLLGATPELIAAGLPDDTFTAIEGDEKKACVSLKKRNKSEIKGMGPLFAQQDADTQTRLEQAAAALENLPDDRVEDIRAKEFAFRRCQETDEYRHKKKLANTWCAAFVIQKHLREPGRESSACGITQGHLNDLAAGRPLPADLATEVERLSVLYKFFHWHLSFPEVFARGGFDCVLGNPPWETMSPDAKEFFSTYDSSVRFLKKEEQQRVIAELLQSTSIAAQWTEHRRYLYTSVHFMKASGRYHHMFAEGNLGKGDFDLYRAFVEIALAITRLGGCAGQVVKSGFYNGANAQGLRKELFAHWSVICVYGFLNTKQYWFPNVHPETRFALYTAHKQGETTSIRTAFGLETAAHLQAALALPSFTNLEAIRTQSPKTLAISETKGDADSALAVHMQNQCPFFGDTSAGAPFRHYQREIDMGTDRDLFGDTGDGLPLMEGRMIDQYDHRAKAYRSGRGRAADWEPLPFGHPGKAITPQWRVPIRNIPSKVGDRVNIYRIAFCDVATPTAPRSLVAALVPPGVICGHKVPTIRFESGFEWVYMVWLAVANSLCLDFLVRKKIALTMSQSVLDSLPLPRLTLRDNITHVLGKLALRLTCTAPEMAGYWNAMSAYGWCEVVPGEGKPPGFFEPDKREDARNRIDALVAHDVFHLKRDELSFVLDSFEALKKTEVKETGEYRTKIRVMQCFDQCE